MIKYKKQQQKTSCSDSGFTIIESLVAIIVVAILLTAIAPVLVLSTATRVQARRVELATQAAKTFIDGIRAGTIAVPSDITPVLAASTSSDPRRISNIPAVAATASTPAIPAITGRPQDYLINTTKMPVPTTSTRTSLYCFNKNGSISDRSDPACTSDLFYIQANRLVQGTGVNDGYRLGIRVYRADVDFSKPLTASTTTTKNTQNPFTGSLGDRQAPLLEMTTDISSTSTSFKALCQRLGVATNTACN
ncbi:hormogonium polysaccharide secretion pseudopilin HpsB [Nostoc parmelioides]|uniref:Type II secretion system protein n=1 Tax=Nostoc parmelioides FACHB-3921 TaxID=2692909 RepID=A0ABR8BKV2_9NOSO|nr:hormogonium polysaccharide secretion pseudopilin HpsB [Nostoc parmelioides]MBD2254130.1 type II secretion system protein [Nostoc parmelioides FACHB-3921]